MFRFLVTFGLAAIVLMLIVAYVRGRRSGGSSGRGALGDGGAGAAAAGWSTDWHDRPTDFTHDSDAGDRGSGGSDGGSGGDSGGDGAGSDSGAWWRWRRRRRRRLRSGVIRVFGRCEVTNVVITATKQSGRRAEIRSICQRWPHRLSAARWPWPGCRSRTQR